jgi:hypothetical protein
LHCSDTPTPGAGPAQTLGLLCFLFELAGALDSGCSVNIDDAERHLRGGDVFEWLAGALGAAADLDRLTADPQDCAALAERLAAVLDAHGTEARRRLKSHHNGLCLLLAAGVAALSVALND